MRCIGQRKCDFIDIKRMTQNDSVFRFKFDLIQFLNSIAGKKFSRVYKIQIFTQVVQLQTCAEMRGVVSRQTRTVYENICMHSNHCLCCILFSCISTQLPASQHTVRPYGYRYHKRMKNYKLINDLTTTSILIDCRYIYTQRFFVNKSYECSGKHMIQHSMWKFYHQYKCVGSKQNTQCFSTVICASHTFIKYIISIGGKMSILGVKSVAYHQMSFIH